MTNEAFGEYRFMDEKVFLHNLELIPRNLRREKLSMCPLAEACGDKFEEK